MSQFEFRFSEAASFHLSIIRIIAAHLVVIGHGVMGRISQLKGGMLGAPGLGVFFALSGILISYSTLHRMNDKKYEFKRFYIKRFARIYPALFVSLIIMAIVDWFLFNSPGTTDILNSYNIPTFLWNLLILQESWWGPFCFGSSRQLWPFPLFWWTYLFFGWLLLGRRNTKSKALYILGLGLFGGILVFICLGAWTSNKLEYLTLWFLGALFMYVINRLDSWIKKRESDQSASSIAKTTSLKKKIKCGALLISIILYILSAIRLLTQRDPYGLIMLLLLNFALFFFIIFSQYIDVEIPEKMKRRANFISSYSYSLFLIQYSAAYMLSFLRIEFNPIFSIVLMYFFSNALGIAIAYFTELRASRIERYILKKLNLG
ncbi:MAG: putative Acyltransferase 3 [Promethearchaeota archaeon]|nr:MAG: putative Acyltransferase 3 [Candidatus Lokiarchaeota archaeon]